MANAKNAKANNLSFIAMRMYTCVLCVYPWLRQSKLQKGQCTAEGYVTTLYMKKNVVLHAETILILGQRCVIKAQQIWVLT